MMDELGDMCVVYDERFGFLVLWDYVDGYFENNSNYDNAEDLYHHLLDKWKFCWIVDKAKVNGTEEFEDYEPSLAQARFRPLGLLFWNLKPRRVSQWRGWAKKKNGCGCSF